MIIKKTENTLKIPSVANVIEPIIKWNTAFPLGFFKNPKLSPINSGFISAIISKIEPRLKINYH